ncbi:MAG: flavin reductase family protein [Bacteroidaceae bacterium]|jgi:flavin reductase (DIM6/NTAB) family NADH-FMN oxidoreductase RutF|nr:flavin reductase family protein [Bacteroidaceae bacterium]MBO5933060.1 flavin reductase family protein [Bacteroidaceae bacterium]MBO5951680.1 flavin reductase family protein [Bacteroidaceae bacterium]MBQ5574333.1 flavin reductase family protein [Bacteroidaceae bacterium]
MKQNFKPGTMIYPLPAVLVSCGATPEEYNVLTVSWTGTICSNPPMCYVSIRPERHSYDIIKRTGAFVINLTNRDMEFATDFCGVKSGRECNKFEMANLTPQKAEFVDAPIILESPVSIECKVVEVKPLGSHDMFIAEVVNVVVEDSYLQENGQLDMAAMNLLAYNHGQYFDVTNPRGFFGWSIRKKKKLKRDIK